MPRRRPMSRDQRLMVWLASAVLALIVAASILAPAVQDTDPRPSTENAGPAGAKAIYLALQSLHRPVTRWDRPLEELGQVDAVHTTLVLAAPRYTALDKERLAGALQAFLARGGRALLTGPEGALLLPGGATDRSRRVGSLCVTEPEGPGQLAAAGEVEISDIVRWTSNDPRARVEQRCGDDAVVVRFPVGAGEAVWWTSSSPLSNAGLHDDGSLRLLLASLGEHRRVLFDESLLLPVRSPWSATGGLPLRSLLLQGALVFGVLVFSFSRRRGPVRAPVAVPRSSPVEFARSMGDLYAKGGATAAATDAARRQLDRTLEREGGISPQLLRGKHPASVARALASRFSEVGHADRWTSLEQHREAALASLDQALRPRAALALVQALAADVEHVRGAAHGSVPPQGADSPKTAAVFAARRRGPPPGL